jgi:hypothetical protein
VATQSQDVQQLQRLQKAREKCEEFSKEKSRLSGETGALRSQIEDLETKTKTDFGCDVKALPGLVQQLRSEAETALSNSEIILGMKTGTIQQPAPDPAPIPTPVQPKASVARPVMKASPKPAPVSHVDEDSLP